MNQVLEVVGPNEIALAEHAAVIRALGKRVVGDVIEIGRRLTLCRDLLKEDRNWRPWLETEFRWSHQTAGRFIQVHELSQKRSNLDHLELPVSGLYLLAARSMQPCAVRPHVHAGCGIQTAQLIKLGAQQPILGTQVHEFEQKFAVIGVVVPSGGGEAEQHTSAPVRRHGVASAALRPRRSCCRG